MLGNGLYNNIVYAAANWWDHNFPTILDDFPGDRQTLES